MFVSMDPVASSIPSAAELLREISQAAKEGFISQDDRVIFRDSLLEDEDDEDMRESIAENLLAVREYGRGAVSAATPPTVSAAQSAT